MSDIVCAKCQVSKPVTDFPLDKRRSTGRASWCRACKAAYYQANKEKWANNNDRPEYKAKWYEQQKRAQRNRRIQKLYGITIEQYEEILQAQNGKCYICQQPETATRRGEPTALHVDHCHTSGKVRRLLCSDCNRGLGCFKDDPQCLLAAAAYLS